MRSKFPAYYRIHKEDLLARFDDCVFMFDACALLDIYRMKKEVTEDVFKVMEHLKEQIRLPYHVAEEYFDNIHDVLNTQIANINKSQSDFNKFIQTLESKRSQPYISKKANDLLVKLKNQVERDFKQQEDYIMDQLLHGEYQNRMNNLMEGRVLEPFTPEQLAEIEKEGEKRIEDKIPPGYKDASKSSNRYGDIINWKEILRFAKESGKCIVIVSSEIKEDWVLREQGCTICLRYELLKEFYQTVGNNNQLIHFLSLDRFLDLAREKDEQVVSEATVNEVKDYVKRPLEEYSFIPYEILKTSTGLEKMIESWKKIQEQYDPKVFQSYRDLMVKMDKAVMPSLISYSNFDKEEPQPPEDIDEERSCQDKEEDPSKDKTTE